MRNRDKTIISKIVKYLGTIQEYVFDMNYLTLKVTKRQ